MKTKLHDTPCKPDCISGPSPMKHLINLASINNEMRISSELIAEQTGTATRSMNRLISNHKTRLETFGQVRFEITPKTKKTVYFLNEDQAIFILTLSKNSEIVVDFKHKLVKAFSRLRRKQAIIDANHAKVEWQQNRELGKLAHRKQTDIIKTFLAYAGAQGSRNYPTHGYSIIAKMINSALSIEDRDSINEQTLHIIATTESICENALQAGMSERLPYKTIFQQAKTNVNNFAAMIFGSEREDK